MTSDSNLTFLGRMIVLPMVTFSCYQNPSVSFQQPDNLYDFISSHDYILWCKGSKKNTIFKIIRQKVFFLILFIVFFDSTMQRA